MAGSSRILARNSLALSGLGYSFTAGLILKAYRGSVGSVGQEKAETVVDALGVIVLSFEVIVLSFEVVFEVVVLSFEEVGIGVATA